MLFFQICMSLALAFNLLALFVSTTTSMTGPGMALRGPEGSVGIAVRHMEQQLKCTLRYFGRGIASFVLAIIVVGSRMFKDTGFAGGFVCSLVGLWTLYALYDHGAEIGEKFYIGSDRTVRDGGHFWPRRLARLPAGWDTLPHPLAFLIWQVRGMFTTAGNGEVSWQNTADERQSHLQTRGKSSWWWRKRWRPAGNTAFTPLWRLDKMISFP